MFAVQMMPSRNTTVKLVRLVYICSYGRRNRC